MKIGSGYGIRNISSVAGVLKMLAAQGASRADNGECDVYNMFKAVGRELAVAFELLCVAALTLLLPWPLAFRGLRWLTRFALFQGDAAVPGARQMAGWLGGEPAHAVRLQALHRLVDVADYFLTRKYGDGWMRRYLHVHGEPLPAPDGGVAPMLVTFHYGQGFWALRWLRQAGYPVAWLHAPPPAMAPLGEKLAAWMGRRRIVQVGRLCGAPTIAVGGSIARMRRRLLEEGRPVMVMPDAPLQPGQSWLPVSLLGREARLPAGAIRMAAQDGVAVLVYSIVVDPRDGHRHLHLEGPLVGLDATALAQRLAAHLQRALQRQPEAWHVWAWASTFAEPEQ